MKYVLLLAALLTAGLLAVAAADGSGVTFVDHDKVAAAISKGGAMVSQPDLIVMGSHRDKAGQVEVHDKESDVIYMIEGEATFVTGGTATGLHRTTPTQSLGTGIEGGETHHLVKGDIIVVPAGVPHWFKEIHPPSISYYVVKAVKP